MYGSSGIPDDRRKPPRRGDIVLPQGPAITLGGIFETEILNTIDRQAIGKHRIIPAFDFANSDFAMVDVSQSDEPFPEVDWNSFKRLAWAWRN
jgi:hypothetical protein